MVIAGHFHRSFSTEEKSGCTISMRPSCDTDTDFKKTHLPVETARLLATTHAGKCREGNEERQGKDRKGGKEREGKGREGKEQHRAGWYHLHSLAHTKKNGILAASGGGD